jgi:hypothetical protein
MNHSAGFCVRGLKIGCKGASKSKTLLFAGSVSKKATQHQGRANLLLFFHGSKAKLPAFKPKLICQKVVVVF